MCFKENTAEQTKNESLILDGKECKGKHSAKDMIKNGWTIQYSQISKNKNHFNHMYMFKKIDTNNLPKLTKSYVKQPISKFNLSMTTTKLVTVNKNIATINLGNLKVGQSGIVINKSNKHEIIVASAIVQSSTSKQSTLILSKSNILLQDAIPTSTLIAKTNDTLVLNHMYNSSVLIAPNYSSYRLVKDTYSNQNFINSDLLAASLKITNSPLPTYDDIQKFTKAYDIGTIFIVAKNKLYIIDAKSLKVLDTTRLLTSNKKYISPFFTKITDIQQGFWSFGDDEIEDYDKFYISLIKKDKLKNTWSILPW